MYVAESWKQIQMVEELILKCTTNVNSMFDYEIHRPVGELVIGLRLSLTLADTSQAKLENGLLRTHCRVHTSPEYINEFMYYFPTKSI